MKNQVLSSIDDTVRILEKSVCDGKCSIGRFYRWLACISPSVLNEGCGSPDTGTARLMW